MTLARTLIDVDDADVGGMTTRAQNLNLERGVAGGVDEVLPSPTNAYMTISQVSRECRLDGWEGSGKREAVTS